MAVSIPITHAHLMSEAEYHHCIDSTTWKTLCLWAYISDQKKLVVVFQK